MKKKLEQREKDKSWDWSLLSLEGVAIQLIRTGYLLAQQTCQRRKVKALIQNSRMAKSDSQPPHHYDAVAILKSIQLQLQLPLQ